MRQPWIRPSAVHSSSLRCVASSTSTFCSTQPREVVDVEESPVVDLVGRDPPVREPVSLPLEQLVQPFVARAIAGHAIERGDAAAQVLGDAWRARGELREPPLRHDGLVVPRLALRRAR